VARVTLTAPSPKLRVAGSAPRWVAELLAGPVTAASVVHRGREAVYLDVRGRCVGVLGVRAALVPCGVRTSMPELPAVAPGTAVLVGGRSVELPGCRVEVVGAVDTAVGRLTGDGVRRARARAQGLLALSDDRLDGVRAALPGAALRNLAQGDPSSAQELLGRGPGLTPLGDDVLSGWLVTAAATGDPALARVRDEVSARTARTTLLSATLLACGARGEALPEVRQLLDTLAGDRPETADRALDRLLAVGGTSGAGLALGCLIGLARTGGRPTSEGSEGAGR
jgi:Protein of unknown function (DUF2877)